MKLFFMLGPKANTNGDQSEKALTLLKKRIKYMPFFTKGLVHDHREKIIFYVQDSCGGEIAPSVQRTLAQEFIVQRKNFSLTKKVNSFEIDHQGVKPPAIYFLVRTENFGKLLKKIAKNFSTHENTYILKPLETPKKIVAGEIICLDIEEASKNFPKVFWLSEESLIESLVIANKFFKKGATFIGSAAHDIHTDAVRTGELMSTQAKKVFVRGVKKLHTGLGRLLDKLQD